MIFTTAYRDYAVEGFELNAVDYLLKPIVFERFFQAIERFIDSLKTTENTSQHIYIQQNRKNIKVVFDSILYIESLRDYIKIHLADDEPITFKGVLTTFSEKLDSRFLRVHRSFVVNTDKVTAFTKNDIEIGNKEIPIGDSYKEDVLRKI